MLRAVCYLFYTELLLNLRNSQEWLYPAIFFLIIICLFPFALTPDRLLLQKLMPGGMWIAALLASLMSSENIFCHDLADGSLEQCLLQAVPLTFFVLAKLSARWIATALPLILITPVLGLLFDFSASLIVMLSLTLLLGTPILTLLSTLVVALTLGFAQAGMLLSLLILPLSLPVLIFGVTIIQQSQAGLSIAGPLAFLAGVCLLAITLLPLTIAATLRISMDDG